VVLEIKEHEVIEHYAALKTHLACLRSDGIRFAVDDAGAPDSPPCTTSSNWHRSC